MIDFRMMHENAPLPQKKRGVVTIFVPLPPPVSHPEDVTCANRKRTHDNVGDDNFRTPVLSFDGAVRGTTKTENK